MSESKSDRFKRLAVTALAMRSAERTELWGWIRKELLHELVEVFSDPQIIEATSHSYLYTFFLKQEPRDVWEKVYAIQKQLSALVKKTASSVRSLIDKKRYRIVGLGGSGIIELMRLFEAHEDSLRRTYHDLDTGEIYRDSKPQTGESAEERFCRALEWLPEAIASFAVPARCLFLTWPLSSESALLLQDSVCSFAGGGRCLGVPSGVEGRAAIRLLDDGLHGVLNFIDQVHQNFDNAQNGPYPRKYTPHQMFEGPPTRGKVRWPDCEPLRKRIDEVLGRMNLGPAAEQGNRLFLLLTLFTQVAECPEPKAELLQDIHGRVTRVGYVPSIEELLQDMCYRVTRAPGGLLDQIPAFDLATGISEGLRDLAVHYGNKKLSKIVPIKTVVRTEETSLKHSPVAAPKVLAHNPRQSAVERQTTTSVSPNALTPNWSKPASKEEVLGCIGISVETLDAYLEEHPQVVHRVSREKWQFDKNDPLFFSLPGMSSVTGPVKVSH